MRSQANRPLLVSLGLLVLLLVSAVSVVYVSHLNRHAFTDYQLALKERDQLDIEWGQLLLEQSALAQHARVEQIVRERLAMKTPDIRDIVLVQW